MGVMKDSIVIVPDNLRIGRGWVQYIMDDGMALVVFSHQKVYIPVSNLEKVEV